MVLSNFLNSLGIDEKGQKVYLALLALADAPVSNIAKKYKSDRLVHCLYLSIWCILYKYENTSRRPGL